MIQNKQELLLCTLSRHHSSVSFLLLTCMILFLSLFTFRAPLFPTSSVFPLLSVFFLMSLILSCRLSLMLPLSVCSKYWKKTGTCERKQMQRVTASLVSSVAESLPRFSFSFLYRFPSPLLLVTLGDGGGNKGLQVRGSEEGEEMCRGLSGHQYFSRWNLGWIIQPRCHAVSILRKTLGPVAHSIPHFFPFWDGGGLTESPKSTLAGIPSFFNLPPLPACNPLCASCWLRSRYDFF